MVNFKNGSFCNINVVEQIEIGISEKEILLGGFDSNQWSRFLKNGIILVKKVHRRLKAAIMRVEE